MKALKILANLLIFCNLAFSRLKMIILKYAFRNYGKNFIFDPSGFYNFNNISVGDDVSIGDDAIFLASKSKIVIGNKVMFGPRVTIVGGNHNTSVVGQFMYDTHEKRPEDDLDVIFEDDIWVGSGAIILKGVRVGRGSIIAAGALVNKDVLPYTVVGGIPARQISTRFKDINTILEHEKPLYPLEKRLTKEHLETLNIYDKKDAQQ
jgi:acetyltransferase-like isoleucine patch superfamily enzyme